MSVLCEKQGKGGVGNSIHSYITQSVQQVGRQVGSKSDGDEGMWAGLEERKAGSQAG